MRTIVRWSVIPGLLTAEVFTQTSVKTIRCLSIVAGILATTGFSQVIGPPTAPGLVNSSAPGSATAPKAPGSGIANPGLEDSRILASASTVVSDWQATPQDANSTEWRRVQLTLNPQTGQWEFQTNHYTALANNLNFTNTLGALEPSSDSIRLMTNTGGAAALKSSMRVYFPPTIGGPSDDPLSIVRAALFRFRD